LIAVVLATTGFLLFLTRLIGVRSMMFAIALVRPSCDQIFDWLKMALGQQLGPGAAINGLVIAMAIVTIAQSPQVVFSAPFLAWASFLLAAAASLFRTPDPSAGLRVVLTLATYAAVFVVPYSLIRSGKEAAQCLMVVLGSSIIPATFALFELVMHPAILTGEERLQSTFTHPNIYAFYIVGVVTVIFYMNCSATLSLSAFMRRATSLYAGFLLFLLLLTQTRSAWLSMLLIMVGYSVVVDRRWLLPILCLPISLFIPGVAERLSDLGTGTVDVGFERLNSLAWRRVLWNDTLEWLAANPPGLLGYGLGAYQSYVPLFFPRGEGQAGVGPHNAFLQIYFETGIIGLAGFTAVIAITAFKLLSISGRDFAGAFTMLLICIGYVAIFYSDNLLDYLQFQWFFWFTLGSVCASTRVADYSSRVRRAIP
jgi:putative inorganic carbon (HCO3(-)) transporter